MVTAYNCCNLFWTLACLLPAVKLVGETSENWWSLDVKIMWNFQSISGDFRRFRYVSERPAPRLTQTICSKFDTVMWSSSSKSLINRCSPFPQTRFSGLKMTMDMTLADENSRFWTIFEDSGHSFRICMYAMNGVWYTPRASYRIRNVSNVTFMSNLLIPQMSHLCQIRSCGTLILWHNVNYIMCTNETYYLRSNVDA